MENVVDFSPPADIDPFTSIEMEQVILAALLADNNAYYRVEPHIDANDFCDSIHRLIYQKCEEFIPNGMKVDPVLLQGSFREQLSDSDYRFSQNYFRDLQQSAIVINGIADYAKNLRKVTKKRNFQNLLDKASAENKRSVLDDDIDLLIEKTEAEMVAVSESSGEIKSSDLADIAKRRMESLRANRGGGIKTGFNGIDEILGALMPGNMSVWGAQTGVGKTALMLTIANNLAQRGKKIAFFSLEMQDEELLGRLTSMFERLAYQAPAYDYSDYELERVAAAHNKIIPYGIRIYDDGGYTTRRIENTARRQKMTFGLDALIIDYIGLIQPLIRSNSYKEMTDISKAIKIMAKNLKVPVLCISQLNRQAADTKKPTINQLRDSGQIEQDADQIMLLSRERVEKPDAEKLANFGRDTANDLLADYESKKNLVTLQVAKNRHWKTGEVRLDWKHGKYVEVA